MTTITIEVTDEQARQLAEEAARRKLTLEDMFTLWIMHSLVKPEPSFHDIAQQVIQENAELYRRLA